MQIILSGVGFKTNEALRTYAEQRVMSWLGHLEREVEIVTVQLVSESQEEGLRTQCRLMARPVGGERLVVQETSADVYEAIDGAPERIAKALEIAVQRRRHHAHAGA
jgi:ribosomal subunit interface protein